MSVAQLVLGCVVLSWRREISVDGILTAWQRADDQLQSAMQEEFTCCGVTPASQNVLDSNTPDAHPPCNSTDVRNVNIA